MSKHDIIIPGGNALSVIFDRLQHELCPAYGADRPQGAAGDHGDDGVGRSNSINLIPF